jgi:hypothetical protein
MVVDVRVQHWLGKAERRAIQAEEETVGSNNLAKNMRERSCEAFGRRCSSKIEISDFLSVGRGQEDAYVKQSEFADRYLL